jgi:hypothetical protein
VEILKKILDLILAYFENKKQIKLEREERERVLVEQRKKTSEMLSQRKREAVKSSTDDDFFGDDT